MYPHWIGSSFYSISHFYPNQINLWIVSLLTLTLAVSLQEKRPQHHLGIIKLIAKKSLMSIWRECFHNNVDDDEYRPQGYTSQPPQPLFSAIRFLETFSKTKKWLKNGCGCIVRIFFLLETYILALNIMSVWLFPKSFNYFVALSWSTYIVLLYDQLRSWVFAQNHLQKLPYLWKWGKSSQSMVHLVSQFSIIRNLKVSCVFNFHRAGWASFDLSF